MAMSATKVPDLPIVQIGHENPARFEHPIYAETIMIREVMVKKPNGEKVKDRIIGSGVRCCRCGNQFTNEKVADGHSCRAMCETTPELELPK